jgi:hypothetical protein
MERRPETTLKTGRHRKAKRVEKLMYNYLNLKPETYENTITFSCFVSCPFLA